MAYMSGDPEEPIFMQGRVTLARTFTHTIINPLQFGRGPDTQHSLQPAAGFHNTAALHTTAGNEPTFAKIEVSRSHEIGLQYTMLTNSPIPYDLCVSVQFHIYIPTFDCGGPTATKIRADVSVSEQLSEEQSRHLNAAVRSAG